jgi:hypothetical protein
MPYPANSSQPFARNRILIGGVILYVCAFAVLLPNKSFDAKGAVVVLIVFGIAFPLIAWITARRAVSLSISVKPSKSELIVLTGYIILLSVYLIGGPQWIDQHLFSSWAESARTKFFITLAKKLIVFIAVPFAIFRFGFGYRIRDIGIQREGLQALRRNHFFAEIICRLFLPWAELSLLSNTFSAAAAGRFDTDILPPINCFLAYRFASFGSSSKPD